MGTVALVTGAGRGLGLEIAASLAKAGAHVILNGRSSVRQAVIAIEEQGGSASSSLFDVADEGAVQTAFAAIEQDYGGLDILVNNVGMRDRARSLSSKWMTCASLSTRT